MKVTLKRIPARKVLIRPYYKGRGVKNHYTHPLKLNMESEQETPLEKGHVPNFGQISQQFDPSSRSFSCFQRSISITEFLGKRVWKRTESLPSQVVLRHAVGKQPLNLYPNRLSRDSFNSCWGNCLGRALCSRGVL